MMTSFRGLLLVALAAILALHTVEADVVLRPDSNTEVELKNVNGGISLMARRYARRWNLGIIGTAAPTVYTQTATNNLAILRFGTNSVLTLSVILGDNRMQINVRWIGENNVRYQDCFKLSPNHWYGGPEQKNQYWPIQNLTFKEYSYVTKEEENNAITEPYWLNSEGTILYVHKDVPLFIDQNSAMRDHLCFVADVKSPYSKRRPASILSYDIVLTDNAKVGHKFAVERYLGKPIAYPDFRMIERPIWTTWARYSRPINESTVMDFADEIIAHGFDNSQFEIDDLWEVCYGSLTVDERRFPDLRQTVRNLKAKGFRVTLWIHPFINEGCEPWFSEARNRDFLVKTENGSIVTSWWNNNGTRASHFDFTNVEATKWWIERLMVFQNRYELDSFKFDAGESGWTPQVPVQRGFYDEHPSHLTRDYVNAVADFGPMIEIRTGQRTQYLPSFVRMIDKDTTWSFNNGLPTLVTTMLQMNMNGYPLVLPDMIGGNGYNDTLPSKELFIRWAQANTFMPSLQYSFVPWDYDNETITICKKYTDLHARYAEEIREVMQRTVDTGSPVNAPIWWISPNDETALGIWDEYLLGDRILVAPILELGQRSRQVYLPFGIWQFAETSELFFGSAWYNISAPLDTLPYFIQISGISSSNSINVFSFLIVIPFVLRFFQY